MKTDLASAVVAAILGFGIAFFATNLFIPAIEDVSFSNLDTSVSSELTEPNEEVFNYKALNPTVEVYVGQCQTFNANGECIDDVINNQSEEETEEETNEESSEEKTEDNSVTPENSTPTEPTDEPNSNTDNN